MKIYDYHPVTFELMQARDARPDPVVPGRFLIPALATKIVPPSTSAREVAVYDEQKKAWSVEPDHRDVPVWLKKDSAERGTFADIGPLPNHLTDKQPPEKEGMKAAWTANGWALKENYTNKIVWSKTTATIVAVDELGPLSADLTIESPEAYTFPVWSVDGWKEDLARARLLKTEEIEVAVKKLFTTTVVTVGTEEFPVDPYLVAAMLSSLQAKELVDAETVEVETAGGDWVEVSLVDAKAILAAIIATGEKIRKSRAAALKAIQSATTLQQIKDITLG